MQRADGTASYNTGVKDHRICNKCVIPESTLIHLDAEGNCRLCSSPSLFRHIIKKPDSEQLARLIERIKESGKNRPFDCIAAWSGGRDSTFMLHELVRTHDLRCVAVFGKTPFTPEEIVESVHLIANRLGVELIEIETPPNHLEIARYCLKKYLASPAPILINLACAACKMVNKEIFRHAHRLRVGAIIYGGNRFEYFPSGPASIDIDSENRYSFLNMVRDNFSRIVRGIRIVINSPALLRYWMTFFKASVLYVNQYTVYLRLLYPDIHRFDYYHYADWNEEKITAVLKNLGWKLPAGCTSSWRADCIFEAVKNTAFKDQLGFTYAEAMYSNLIRAGKMTREEARIRLEKETISEPRLRKALELCGLPANVFTNSDK